MIEYLAQYGAGYLGALLVLLAVRRVVANRRARRRAGEWTVSGRTLELLDRQQGVRR